MVVAGEPYLGVNIERNHAYFKKKKKKVNVAQSRAYLAEPTPFSCIFN